MDDSTTTQDDGSGETLGGRIVDAREAQNLTTSQLARRLGIKTATLQGWETDRAEPRSNRLITLAGVLNVSPTWLLVGSGESPSGAMTATEMMRIRANVDRLRKKAVALADELEALEQRLERYTSHSH